MLRNSNLLMTVNNVALLFTLFSFPHGECFHKSYYVYFDTDMRWSMS